MRNETALDYEGVQMLFLLDTFRKKSSEVRGISKLFLLMTLLKHPSLLKQKISEDFNESIKIEQHFFNNVELEAIKQKKYINLDTFFATLARLVSKSLVIIINQKNYKQVKVNGGGLDLLEKLDDYEWYDVKDLCSIIKKNYGGKSFEQLQRGFKSITPILFGERC